MSMLWKSRAIRPGTREGGRRRHSIIEAPRSTAENTNGQSLVQTVPKDSVKNDSQHSIGALPFEQEPQSAASPLGSKYWLEPQDAAQTLERQESPTQSERPKRFSLMMFRHASDPQLAKSYAAASDPQPPPALPSKLSCACLTSQDFLGLCIDIM